MESMTQCPMSNCADSAGPVFLAVFIMLLIFTCLIVTIVKILIVCKIFSKAGYCWALGLLIILPLVNIIMAFYLAFADWPVLKELRELKLQQGKT